MKQLIIMALMALTAIGAQAQTKSWTADNGNGTYTNPLFYDEFSDPDVIKSTARASGRPASAMPTASSTSSRT